MRDRGLRRGHPTCQLDKMTRSEVSGSDGGEDRANERSPSPSDFVSQEVDCLWKENARLRQMERAPYQFGSRSDEKSDIIRSNDRQTCQVTFSGQDTARGSPMDVRWGHIPDWTPGREHRVFQLRKPRQRCKVDDFIGRQNGQTVAINGIGLRCQECRGSTWDQSTRMSAARLRDTPDSRQSHIGVRPAGPQRSLAGVKVMLIVKNRFSAPVPVPII